MKLMCKTPFVNRFPQAMLYGVILCGVGIGAGLGACAPVQPLDAQNTSAQASTTSLPFEVASMTLRRFEKEVVLGVGKEATRYKEAVVIVVEVEEEELDRLSPSIAPRLVVDGAAFGIHRMLPVEEKGAPRRLEFHIPEWKDLEEGSQMYLTTEDPRRLGKRVGVDDGAPRFEKSKIQRPS